MDVIDIEAFPNVAGADYRTRRYVIAIDEKALFGLDIDEDLRGALYECETSYSVADKILALWFLAKRLERAHEREKQAGPILPQILLIPKHKFLPPQEKADVEEEAIQTGEGTVAEGDSSGEPATQS